MAREALIIGAAVDFWGDGWDVREFRPTAHGFAIALGWPVGATRGKGGAGGPRVVVTDHLAAYLDLLAGDRGVISLPLGATAIKRLRRLLGLNAYLDRAAWWEERAVDLSEMTLQAFAEKHGVSTGAASHARTALFGRSLRPAGWWRQNDVKEILLSGRPRADIADDLHISVGSVGRLRWALKEAEARAFSPAAEGRKSRKPTSVPMLAAMQSVKLGMPVRHAALKHGVSQGGLSQACRRFGVPLRPKGGRLPVALRRPKDA